MHHPGIQRLLALGVLLALGLGAANGQAATSTEVYRCTARDGSIEFRQGPCDASAQAQPLTLEDRPTGWHAPKLPAAPLEPAAKPRKQVKQSDAAERAAEAQARHCWEKRERLEEVDARL